MKTALVLAGGGAKGAFEAGAIRYLVEERGLVPDIITATSAGAVVAAVLAQGRTLEELIECSNQLRRNLLALTHTRLLFAKQPWAEALAGTYFGRLLDTYLTEALRPPVPSLDSLASANGGPSRADSAARSAQAAEPRAAGSLEAGFGRRGLRGAVGLAVEIARVLPRIPWVLRGLRRDRSSILTLEPLGVALRHGGPNGLLPIDPLRVARPGLELRLAVTALGAGVLRYVTQDGTIVESDAITPVAGSCGKVDLVEGVLASASVPIVFPPRALGDDVYSDGGVLHNVPVKAAARLGAEEIIAVLAVPLAQAPSTHDFTKASLVEVFLRTLGGIAFADRQVANLRYPLPPSTQLTIVDPVTDIVGPFEVAPGLIAIDMDYGWLRAADVLTALDEARRAALVRATETLVTARARAWYVEEQLWRAPGDQRARLRELRQLKVLVKEALCVRDKEGLPAVPGADAWWGGYEVHVAERPRWLPPEGSLLD